MGRWSLAAFLAAVAVSMPSVGSAQQGAVPETCVALGDPTGLYRSQDGEKETRWRFNSAGDTARPGDPFLAEHSTADLTARLGPGVHYVLFGAIGPDCETVAGTWRAVFAPDGDRLMAGSFSAEIEPGTITFTQADDDADEPHGFEGVSYGFVDEPDPPVLIVFAEPLEHHGLPDKRVAVALEEQLQFAGERSTSRTVALSDTLEFRARMLRPQTIDLAALEFRGSRQGPTDIVLSESLSFAGKLNTSRMLELSGTLEFRGKPFAQNTIVFSEPLQFSGDRHGMQIVAPAEVLRFSGTRPSVQTVTMPEPLEFRHRRLENRSVETAALSFRGESSPPVQTVSLAAPLIFRGPEAVQRPVVMPARLVFPGDTASARAALIARPADPAGAGPCGALVGDSVTREDFSALIPASPDDVSPESIDRLRAAYAPYADKTARALDAEADCMEKRLQAFSALIDLSPHDRWAQNPAFSGQSFYSSQIEALRNAALYLRQVDWELTGIDQTMKDEETFYIFDLLDDPEAMKFGLVTEGDDGPSVQGSNSMKARDFELLQKHAENDANALLTQRNRYFQRKIAQRFRYLDALMARTIDGLADWTTIENNLTREFMPRVASTITARINELKQVHDDTQPATSIFVVPQGEFDNYLAEFNRLAQTSGPKIGNATFRDFMNNKVWYSDYDPWPDAAEIER